MNYDRLYVFKSEFDKLYEKLISENSSDIKSAIYENRNKQAQLADIITEKIVLYIRKNFNNNSRLVNNNKHFICYVDKKMNCSSSSLTKLGDVEYSTIFIVEKDKKSLAEDAYYNNDDKNIYINLYYDRLLNLTNFDTTNNKSSRFQINELRDKFYAEKSELSSIIRHEMNHFIELRQDDPRSFKEKIRIKFSSKVRVKRQYELMFSDFEDSNEKILNISNNRDVLDFIKSRHSYLLKDIEICSHIVEINSYVNNFTTKKHGELVYCQKIYDMTFYNGSGQFKFDVVDELQIKQFFDGLINLNMFVMSIYTTAFLIKYPTCKKHFNHVLVVGKKRFQYNFEKEKMVEIV